MFIHFVLSNNEQEALGLEAYLTTLDPSLMEGVPSAGPQPSEIGRELVDFGTTVGYVVNTGSTGSSNDSYSPTSAVAVAPKDGYVVQAFVSVGADVVTVAKHAMRDALGTLQGSG